MQKKTIKNGVTMKHTLLVISLGLFLASSVSFSQNYYLGVGNGTEKLGQSCSSCHQTGNIGAPIYNTWKLTAHAVAMDAPKPASFGYDCLQCHNTGWDPNVVNYGADEYVVKDPSKTPNYTITDSTGWNRVKNVQCEACHGPLGTKDGWLDISHWDFNNTNKLNYSAQLCGKCHQGAHTPYLEEWSMSLHAQSTSGSVAFVTKNKTCVRCHVAQNFIAYAKDPANYKDTILVTGSDIQPITCVACHDPHDAKYPGQLRFDITGSKVICDQCHTTGIDSVNINVAPHHTTSEALTGSKLFGYQYPGHTYSNSGHTYAATERCINCHVNTSPDAQGNPSTGHTFEPRVQACIVCHSDYYTSVDTADPAKRFDYRGVQTKTKSLIDSLQAAITAHAADSLTAVYKEAVYNLEAVQSEGSYGIHNTALVQKLLRDAIASFSGVSGVENTDAVPTTYSLSQNYPNPFNPSTTISFSIPQGNDVKVVVYDAIGREVATLINSYLARGSYKVEWNAGSYPSGVYFYRISTKNFNMVKKMVLLK